MRDVLKGFACGFLRGCALGRRAHKPWCPLGGFDVPTSFYEQPATQAPRSLPEQPRVTGHYGL